MAAIHETPVSGLPPDILETLGMYLNPRLPLKDFRTLGGKMGYTYMRLKNFEIHYNPTTALLEDWWTENDKSGTIKTVSSLIELLSEMKRDDAVDVLKPYVYSEIPTPSTKTAPQKPSVIPPYSTSPFGSYSQRDLRETKPGVENDFLINNNMNLPYNSTPEDAIASGVQNTLANSISPNGNQSPSATTRQAIGRHPATFEPNGRNRPENRTNGQINRVPPQNNLLRERTTEEMENKLTTRQQDEARPVEGTPADDPMSLRLPVVSDKVALVLGNQDYQCEKLQGLYYPMTDASDVAKSLWELGFKVVSLVNLTLSEMRIAVLSFCRLLGKGVYAVLYYAGHGFEDGGENFLLPVDANLKYNRQDSLCAQEILQTMQGCSTALNLLIIDSCRIRLPEKANRPTYVKRLASGNNIFAYSCCSQQEAYEEPNQRNGLYAHHLLQHIKRPVRIERILMDVATGVTLANNRHINQRPCLESDAVVDCRLTDPIHPRALPDEYRERVDLWQKAHALPQPFRVCEDDGLIIDFNLKANFSNVLEVMMIAYNTTDRAMNRFVMDLRVSTPVLTDVRMLTGDTLLPHSTVRQVVRLSALQKLQDKLMATMQVFYGLDEQSTDLEKEVDLGCPLVSSVFTQWDWWVTCGRTPPSKSTSV